jgi:DNA repair exonuclease SbcCD ATPase subunit
MDASSSRLHLGVVVALGLGCVGLAAYAIVASQKVSALEEQLNDRPSLPVATAKPASAGGEDAQLLRRLLEEKESAYNKVYDELERLKKPGAAATEPRTAVNVSTNTGGFGRGRGGGGFGGSDWLERLKTEDPERYKQITESMEQRRQQAETQYQQSLARIQERRQKAGTDDEVAHLDALAGSLTKLHEIGQSWENLRNLSGEERSQAFRQLTQDSATAYQTYSDLKTKDRQVQLNQLAAQVGYKDTAQAEQFTAAVKRIYEETDPGLRGLMGGSMFWQRGGRGERNSSTTIITPTP